ncbi:vomeronasal type-2 receptor 26-like [Dendropsophus ebraccatus]|uniref:vomeronasal type-2 receptor 26-like n=1 Tax=Dendropsophus ebraccatus TaxID=150705 RepID=UPI0038317F44
MPVVYLRFLSPLRSNLTAVFYLELFAHPRTPHKTFWIGIEEWKNEEITTSPGGKPFTELLTFIFAIDEVNKDPELLPNITLGYHIYDTCEDKITYVHKMLNILSGERKDVPNYSCRHHGKVTGLVSESFEPADIRNIYNHPKISYGMTESMQKDTDILETHFKIGQNEKFWCMATVSLLEHFGWNWVGIIVSDEGNGESELLYLTKEMARRGICIGFVLKIHKYIFHQQQNMISKSTPKVFIICGKYSPVLYLLLNTEVIHRDRTLILSESWYTQLYMIKFYHRVTNCSLIFLPLYKPVPGLESFLSNINLNNRPNDPLLEDLHFFTGNCFPNVSKLRILQQHQKKRVRNCTSDHINLLLFYSTHTSYYSVYTAVHTLAHAIHDMTVYLTMNYTGSRDCDHSQMRKFTSFTTCEQSLKQSSVGSFMLSCMLNVSSKEVQLNVIMYFVKRINYLDYNGEKISCTKERRLNSRFPLHIANLIVINNTTNKGENENVLTLDTGSYFTAEDQFYPPTIPILWKDDRMPQARCNDPCSPGFRKAPNGGYHVCCYNCVPCSEGEVSNVTDSEICHRCPDDGWPDEKKVTCVPKTYTFLSYEDDIVITFIFTSLLLSALTIIILGIFIYHWDSPIVRANNRIVSFILLVSILLSFLCIFLFLGRPVDITCMLRQTIFGIFFSISVSSVLSKTLTVCIAFKATKPGSIWRKLIGVRTSTYVLGICSSIQALISVSWMSASPPYQEFDMTSYVDQILIQCNEGSDIWFFSMLGYLGFLAVVSFVLAFMVRTLPDTFNEAKYITFSMLVFCSVWIAMIPAYLSTRGKYMAAMEIFAILASSAGLLGCIFLPKYFIMVMSPYTNVKRNC